MLIIFPVHTAREFSTICKLGSPIVFTSANDIAAIHAWNTSVLCAPTHSRLTLTKASNGQKPRAESLSGVPQPQLQRPNSVLWTTNTVLTELSSIVSLHQEPTAAGSTVCDYFSQPALQVVASTCRHSEGYVTYKLPSAWGGQHSCL